jgi:hypothetical protein
MAQLRASLMQQQLAVTLSAQLLTLSNNVVSSVAEHCQQQYQHCKQEQQ